MGVLRRWRDRMDRELADALDDVTDWFDKTADAAMLEPGVPAIPEQRQPPRDIMGGAG